MKAEVLNSLALTLDFLRRQVADVDDDQMTRQVSGAVNHPAWVIGHLTYSFQALGGEFGMQPWLAKDWGDRFGTGSTPTSDPTAYPTKASLLRALDDAQRRINEAVAALEEVELSAPLPDLKYRDRLPTVGHAVLHVLSAHAANHVGQVTVWRRTMGLGVLTEPFA